MSNIKIIGISGGSGAGKTTLANALLQHYGGEALLISYDRYYKTMPCDNYDIPEALDTELLAHLRLLRSGQAVDLPIYDRFINQRTEIFDKVEPQPVVIFEAIFAFHYPGPLILYDSRIFVKTLTNDVRFHTMMIRDIKEHINIEVTGAKACTNNVIQNFMTK